MSANGQSEQGLNEFPYGQAGLSAVERAREVARQVAERQREIAAAHGPGHIVVLESEEPAFTPDQRELRQLLAVKLRALAADLDTESFKRPHAGEIRQRVARLQVIAGAME